MSCGRVFAIMARMTQARNHTEHGDREVAVAGEVLRTEVGSGVHGIAIKGTDDHDEMGIYVEPAARVLGFGPRTDHYIYRTQPEGARSGPGDVDLVMYSLRKYLRLATKGNPTVLLPLYAPPESVMATTALGDELRAMRRELLSQQAVHRFLGFLHSQRKRLLGQEKRNVPNRPELIARYGYDVKYASHALRLAYQGLEIARDARLTLPMPEHERERVLRVKRGDVRDMHEALAEIDGVAAQVEQLLADGRTPLPERPDLDAITAWATDAHRRHWGWR
ncbi:putative nucleotidyltransferase [Labedaea rhizosphaerae]|uniref:Putative nucleotidyltransferase n=2 Tax=Labedaea rhizosphaerae TaxID=598644 RepID=A0A4V3CZW7_LABRH|nr:putative nucleotidyltransferase [Labedaea rhizosphaerae]